MCTMHDFVFLKKMQGKISDEENSESEKYGDVRNN